MATFRATARELSDLVSVMTGEMEARHLYLYRQERWIAQAMAVTVEMYPRPPEGPSLPDLIDVASRSFLNDIEETCNLAGLDDVQSETLVERSRRGIEAFTKACGMAVLEQIRSGKTEPDRDAMLLRVDQLLPRILGTERPARSIPFAGRKTRGVNGLL